VKTVRIGSLAGHKVVRILAIVGVVAACSTVTGALVAAAARPTTAFYACLKNGSLVNVGTTSHTCSKGKAVEWNSVGPQGPGAVSVFTEWQSAGNFGGSIKLAPGSWIVSDVLVGGIWAKCALSADGLTNVRIVAAGMDFVPDEGAPQSTGLQNDQDSSDLVTVGGSGATIPFFCNAVGGGIIPSSGVVMTAIPTAYTVQVGKAT
jgi:hypothetical protein